MAFGFAYFIWGMRRAQRQKTHEHAHAHVDGSSHHHLHAHEADHIHLHGNKKKSITPWILFTIFVFGPCEPLIPLIMYPAARHNLAAVATVSFVFGSVTIATMMTLVTATSLGLARLPVKSMESYSHALAGFVIFACGVSMVFLGL